MKCLPSEDRDMSSDPQHQRKNPVMAASICSLQIERGEWKPVKTCRFSGAHCPANRMDELEVQ